jgi:transposase
VQCCENCGLVNNRDVNAATNILLALQSLATTGERHVDLQRPNNEDSEDKGDEDDASDYSSDDSDSDGKVKGEPGRICECQIHRPNARRFSV